MALVMLPCDLPWWPAVTKQLDKAARAKSSSDLVDAMQKIHEMCNISLDPDEDSQEPDLFVGLAHYLDKDLSQAEREHVFTKTIPSMVTRAKTLKSHKPPHGLHFSLQQQGDTIEHSYAFVASLVANAFFSTYPKRTQKTHPTLGDFNFTNFFKHLNSKSQKAKLRAILEYFDWLEENEANGALDGKLLISRQVMMSKQWLTIEDWLESGAVLCPLSIRHEGRLERAETEIRQAIRVCFSSRSLGQSVLQDGSNQESIQIATHPELLAAILSVEALEDNEALIIEGLRHISRIQDPKHRATFERISDPNTVTLCCIDAEDYSSLPLAQFEEDNVLRELNKSLLGFRQRRPARNLPTVNQQNSTGPNATVTTTSTTQGSGTNSTSTTLTTEIRQEAEGETGPATKRLSPIGESFSSASPEIMDEAARKMRPASLVIVTPLPSQASGTTPSSETGRTRGNGCSTCAASPGMNQIKPSLSNAGSTPGTNSVGRNRFIVLGSSGEALPVTRKSIGQTSMYDSCNSQSTDSYHSAKDTIDEETEIEIDMSKRYNEQLDTPERRGTFAQRLKEALRRESSATGTTTTATSTTSETTSESSYAVGISVAGSQLADKNIKVKRGGSRGFVLKEETVDEEFLKESLEAELRWLGRFRQYQPALFQRKEAGTSSKYSFSTEYSSDFCSELEEVYEQLSRWLEEPPLSPGIGQGGSSQQGFANRELDPRDRALMTFAGSLLKRALSESFAGVPVQEGEPQPFLEPPNADDLHQRHKLALAVRSLSLELARQRSRRNQPDESKNSCSPHEGDLLPVATGNWGCGSSHRGDPQLKLVIQWMAASMAGVPRLVYYTYGHSSLSKLDTVSRVLTDRQWSVGDLAAATLRFSVQALEQRIEGRNSLFEELIGVDKPSP
ncbi:hypothetical protein QAD02_022945 [Eretmocerus hayati]|uniref:Uncharacterized protein n=1 Tax=Eretmocerus hayati TaxID=131215 RepID=A0ACC2PW36_9HYME|nr:hypothetical protein QAD02_022945 [Eretmocerus hayati]